MKFVHWPLMRLLLYFVEQGKDCRQTWKSSGGGHRHHSGGADGSSSEANLSSTKMHIKPVLI